MSKKIIFFSSLMAAVAGASGVVLMLTPSSEAVRIRNAFLIEAVDESILQWTPAEVPVDFKQESGDAPQPLVAAAMQLRGEDRAVGALEFGRRAGHKLGSGGRRGGEIQSSTLNTFETILSEGTGYCADYTQVFNGLAHAAGVPVREWGMSFDGFGGKGHAFNEVYDEVLRQWIFIDTFYAFYVVDRASNRPLSALEFRDRLRDMSDWTSIRLIAISDGGYRFESESAALSYYQKGVEQFFLIYGNNVFEYDSAPAVKLGSAVSRSAEQLLGIVGGVYPEIRVPRTPRNTILIENLEKTKNLFLAFTFLTASGALVSFVAAIIWFRKRHSRCAASAPAG